MYKSVKGSNVSNLGFYQDATRVIKVLGGPKYALPVLAVASYGTLRGVEAGAKRLYRVTSSAIGKRRGPSIEPGQLFKVHSDAEDVGGGLSLRSEDEFRVLECDDDAILIEVLNRLDNPFFVSRYTLVEISSFPDAGEDGDE